MDHTLAQAKPAMAKVTVIGKQFEVIRGEKNKSVGVVLELDAL